MEHTIPQKIAIIGSTGSIGTQTLETIASYPNLFKAEAITARSNAKLLIEQALQFKPSLVVITDETKYAEVKEALSPHGIAVESGSKALEHAASLPNVDTVVTATVGYSGLAPTMAAIRSGKRIALANKETLVVAGEMITQMLGDSTSTVIPVDSEHSAIYQCLQGEKKESVSKLIITASGGPFRTFSEEQLKQVTPADALRHPNWDMGAKITIDSASMMNKAFEIIEARWLFDITADRIEAVVHPQSIVHSMVQFRDGAIKAQLGLPDMRLPIRYALAETNRLHTNDRQMEIADYASLTFEKPDLKRFPCLGYAAYSLQRMGTTACTVNAANEIAVAAFLNEKIGFCDIHRLIELTLEKAPFVEHPTYEDYVAVNSESRRIATELTATLAK